MPQKYISAIEGVWVMIDWVRANSTIVGVFFMTLFAAILRSHKDGKVDFIEAIYCALIAVGLSTALVAVNLPEGLSWVVAVFIGSVGSQWFRKSSTRLVETRIDELENKVNSVLPKDDDNATQ
ncbi:MAG TPA: phage holin family protein [Gammaproteobacteria bacterium]|nr:phage holin family protein [Gammaproteobacteria bacterium]